MFKYFLWWLQCCIAFIRLNMFGVIGNLSLQSMPFSASTFLIPCRMYRSRCNAGRNGSSLLMWWPLDSQRARIGGCSLLLVAYRCFSQGVTRLLLTKIPMFREVILTSFHCPHCGSSNREIQPGAPIQDQGVRYTLNVNKNKEVRIHFVWVLIVTRMP